MDFRTGGVVVYGAFVHFIFGSKYIFQLLFCQFGRHIDVFRPAAGSLLIEQDIVANADGFRSFKEFVV